jgi:hypothetical protein
MVTVCSRINAIVLLHLTIPAALFAQTTGTLDTLSDHLSIRQSLKDKNTINEPAFVTMTIPDEGPTVNVVAVAATAFLKPQAKNPRFNVGVAMQFNQNSAADERQNIFVSAVDLEARGGMDDASTEFFSPRLKANSGYKRNGEKTQMG